MEKQKEFIKLLNKAGRVVYSVNRHVSSSGMSRAISFFVAVPLTKKEQEQQKRRGINPKTKIICIDWKIENLGLYKEDRNHGGLKVQGCGMDMHFSVVYNLGRVLFPKGDGKTITGRNGDTEPETDGGYLLQNEKL